MLKKFQAIAPLLTKVEGLVVNTNTGEAPRLKQYYAHWELKIFDALTTVCEYYNLAYEYVVPFSLFLLEFLSFFKYQDLHSPGYFNQLRFYSDRERATPKNLWQTHTLAGFICVKYTRWPKNGTLFGTP